jgi:methylated-DNA-protein-cysteine methyltransferase-like protein
MKNSFFENVYQIVAQIPHGKVATYGQIARLLGNPRAARQVGWAMRQCPDGLPWQRVIMSDGSVAGGFFPEIRESLLRAEGVVFRQDGRIALSLFQ